jgi:hypothetical protein
MKLKKNRHGAPVVHDDVNIEFRWHPGIGTLAARHYQPNRDLILEANKRMRNEQVIRDLGWMRFALRVPQIDLIQLKKLNPELNSPDGQIKARAWKKFAKSPESLPYRVRDKI